MSTEIACDPPTSLLEGFVPQYPFQAASGDVVLRSSDSIDFRVYRAILALASPVFSTMFSLPQPDSAPETPIIPVGETALRLDRALRFWYPGTQPLVNSIDELGDVLQILMSKYDIQAVSAIGQRFLLDYVETQPVAVFGIALTYEWHDIAKTAAAQSLKHPLRTFGIPPEQLKHISSEGYHTLLKYHYLCGAAAKGTTDVLRWIAFPNDDVWFACTKCAGHALHWFLSDNAAHGVRLWFTNYLAAAGTTLAATPGADPDDPIAMHAALKAASACEFCREKVFHQLQDFVATKWIPKIEEVLGNVELKM
ncbi:hypothetical protein B0H15DRAFT_894953 [Mycena belliarum]|uniref:BTB domain-containing protein n=1 Tax=Mycena belliarum TaxID=1033014 RepID=A0AAD6XLR1_9AGAR|nr:hypothetical protein B0H15DRAFT_894953 [Mycena belliae]